MSVKLQKSRKHRKCGLCGRLIEKGQKYWRDYGEDKDSYDPANSQHTNCLLYEHLPIIEDTDLRKMNKKLKKE